MMVNDELMANHDGHRVTICHLSKELIQCSPSVSPGLRSAQIGITMSTQLRHPFLRMRRGRDGDGAFHGEICEK